MKKLRELILRVLTTHAAWPILICVGLLCMVSVLAIELASKPGEGFADRQRLFVGVGAAIVILTLIPNFQSIGQGSYVFFGIGLVMLVAVFFTQSVNGARRWFQTPIGFSLQPSEFAKITYVMALAWYLRYHRNIRELSGLLPPFLLMLIPFVLILMEPDLGTALLFPLVLYAMLIAAGAKLRHLIVIAVVTALALPGAYPFLKPYQQERITSLVVSISGQGGEEHRMGVGYQPYQARIALGSGGITGQGPEGAQHIKQGLLPEAHTDFIYAVVGTQWGFVGCVGILLLYLGFFAASVEIAATCRDPFGRLLVIGLSSLVVFQVVINVGMTVGIFPVVGIALPFVSYGGSSLLTNMVAAGLLLNVSVRRQANAAPAIGVR